MFEKTGTETSRSNASVVATSLPKVGHEHDGDD
jgi:hypothetical protein